MKKLRFILIPIMLFVFLLAGCTTNSGVNRDSVSSQTPMNSSMEVDKSSDGMNEVSNNSENVSIDAEDMATSTSNEGVSGDSIDETMNSENSHQSVNSGVEREFVLIGENYKFIMKGLENPDIRVKKGDKVTVIFSSTNGYHDFVIDEFNIATKRVRPEDGDTIIEFTADKSGEFTYYCSVGSHRQLGMFGKLIVQ